MLFYWFLGSRDCSNLKFWEFPWFWNRLQTATNIEGVDKILPYVGLAKKTTCHMERFEHTPTWERVLVQGSPQLRPSEISWKSHVFRHFVTDTRRKWTKVWFPFDKKYRFLNHAPFDYSTFTGSQVSQRFTVTGVRWHFWNALGFSEFTFGGFLIVSFTWGCAQIFPCCSHPRASNHGFSVRSSTHTILETRVGQ